MTSLSPQLTKMDSWSPQKTGSWGTPQIIAVSVLGAVACAALFASLIGRIRANKISAELDNTAAELGVQQERASSLEKELIKRDVFIMRNVLKGPEAYAFPEPRPRQSRPAEDHDDRFTVGSDDDSDVDDEENWSIRCVAGGSLRSLTPQPAILVQPGSVKTVTLQSRRPQNLRDVDLDRPSSKDDEPGEDAADQPEVHQAPSNPPEPVRDSGIDDYWLANGAT